MKRKAGGWAMPGSRAPVRRTHVDDCVGGLLRPATLLTALPGTRYFSSHPLPCMLGHLDRHSARVARPAPLREVTSDPVGTEKGQKFEARKSTVRFLGCQPPRSNCANLLFFTTLIASAKKETNSKLVHSFPTLR